jgi:hypothetical protein
MSLFCGLFAMRLDFEKEIATESVQILTEEGEISG